MLGNVLLVLATSLDGLSAGVAYGLRGLRFPWFNRVLAAGISVLSMMLAMACGGLLGGFFPGPWARLIGGVLLLALGLWTIGKALMEMAHSRQERKVWSWHLPSLGLVIQILRQPARADLDSSGGISASESLWLGLALSLDAFGAGFCANLGAHLPIYLALAVGVVNLAFLCGGIAIGRSFRREKLPFLAVVPGLILAALGLLRFF